MKAWIGIYIRSDKQGLLNGVENALPNRFDSRLWDTEQFVAARGVDIDGVEIVTASIFFNDFNERASFRSALGGISGFLHAAMSSSFLKMSKCYHDELDGEGNPTKSDELEYSEVVE